MKYFFVHENRTMIFGTIFILQAEGGAFWFAFEQCTYLLYLEDFCSNNDQSVAINAE